ncbi:hypothetical protein [Gloeothece verrucosa]|uniref:Uncharacterized protein n=1 Tax=Gloeothece verrucosa (strain PCC 7822) TaxID=497965 RepID=E0UNW8_GLOV7|nr:hypothetical protein [Gloeothece verrucosa]ADN18648.1 hypothetical protein Cyan7822_6703 [Gloeothece verrucosa PCC 7822]
MTGNNRKQPVLLLPRLKADCDVKKEVAGQWNVQPEKAFNDVANSLEYDAPGEVNRISSVPTMWARPLTLEMVLYDRRHSLRPVMVSQWQGMLAALALAELRGLPLTAQLIELGKNNRSFAKSLSDLLPDYKGRNLYILNNKHPWEDVYVFLWNNKPVGMSSPSTLVVPSEAGNWEDLPWWNLEKQCLEAPQSQLNKEEKGLLWGWLKNLNEELDNHNGHEDAINIIQGLIGEFQSTLESDPSKKEILSEEPQFFGVPINRGALIGLNYPVKAPEQPSSVKLIASGKKEGEKLPLLLYDPAMPGVWGEEPQNIWIHGGKTLASLRPEELEELKTRWKGEVIVLEKEELFLEELYFIDLDEALPGALLPDARRNDSIIFNNKRVTPLISLNPMLLDYFTPEDLLNKIKFQTLKGEGNKVRLMLNLPLSGVQENNSNGTRNNRPFQDYLLYKDYELKEENLLPDQLPVLEVWPNFQAKGWKEYYGFYYDADLGEATFQVSFPKARYAHALKQGRGTYQMVHLESFPECIHCLDGDKTIIGLILLKSPETVSLSKNWSVGVDLGTSFTNIYVNKKDVPEPLFLENLLHRVTKSNRETRLTVLFEHFIPEDFIPKEKPLPLSSVLTIKGRNVKNEKMLSIVDGRIYVPDSSRFEPQEDWIKTDLKWLPENIPFNELFIKDLALYITALVAKAGVKEIQWSLSYPSAFSRRDKKRYAQVWKDLTTELEKTTGIKQNHPEIDSDNLRTESLAVAQYFADFEGHDLVYTTCIDLGGGTSDISIWEDNQLLHQCSVQLAGRDIFSQFLAMNPKFLEQKLKFDPKKWKDLRGGAFNAKMDVWLRLESENWLRSQRTLLQDDPDLQGLVRLTAIGIAGLYYYVGILLKVLNAEEKYQKGQITPVYIGGNGSRFLKWLDNGGEFNKNSEVNELLSRMLSAGSGFEDTEQLTRLSQRPKDEAACGLVLQGTKLKGMGKKVKDPLIAGEKFEIKTLNQANNEEENTQIISAESRLWVDEDLDVIEFKVPELVQLPKFLCEFHNALRNLDIEEITPLKGYVRSPERDKNKKLWDDTERELNNMLLKLKEDAQKNGDAKKNENDKSTDKIRWEPPFILGLKALLQVLGKEWAGK